MDKETLTIIAEIFIITNTCVQCYWLRYTLNKDKKKPYIK